MASGKEGDPMQLVSAEWVDGWMDGSVDGWTDRRMEGWDERRKEGKEGERRKEEDE